VGQKRVSEACTLSSAFDQTSDIDELQVSRDFTRRMENFTEISEALIGNRTTSFVGVNCAKRKVLSRSAGIFTKKVE
jgi:hypothetical protein